MIAQWDNKCISVFVLPMARVQFPNQASLFQAFFPWSKINLT